MQTQVTFAFWYLAQAGSDLARQPPIGITECKIHVLCPNWKPSLDQIRLRLSRQACLKDDQSAFPRRGI